MNSQGLRLNSGKSRILSAKDAIEHFWVQENRYLTIIENSIANGVGNNALRARKVSILEKRFRRLERRRLTGNWEKVYKRYLRIFGMLRVSFLESRLRAWLEDVPTLRGAALRYLQVLGPSPQGLRIIEGFLTSGHCEDEASLFEAVKCIVSWEVPANGPLAGRISRLAQRIAHAGGACSPAEVTAALWLLAKYGSRASLGALVKDFRSVWSRNSWAARQVAAIVPLVSRKIRILVIETAAAHGLVQALQVLASIFSLQRLKKLDRQLEAYLGHTPQSGVPYSIQKVITARAVLDGALEPAEKQRLTSLLGKVVTDERYRAILELGGDGTRQISKLVNRPVKLMVAFEARGSTERHQAEGAGR